MLIKNYYCPTCKKFITGLSVECIGDESQCWLRCKTCKNKAYITKDIIKKFIESEE